MNAFLVILGLVAAFGGIVWIVVKRGIETSRSQWSNEKKQKSSIKGQVVLTLIGVILLVISGTFSIIPTGYTGVRTTFGQIEEGTLPNGLVTQIPIAQSVKLVNNMKQDVRLAIERIEGESAEKVNLYIDNVLITYQINPESSSYLIRTFSDYDESNLLDNLSASAIKSAMKNIPAEDATNRNTVEPILKAAFQEKADEKYGKDVIIIHSVRCEGDLSREASYDQAIIEQNKLDQEAVRVAKENEIKVATAKADAEATREKAQGAADARVIEAKSIAEANEMLEESLTDGILSNKLIEKWNGVLPVFSGADGTMMLDVDKFINQGTTE